MWINTVVTDCCIIVMKCNYKFFLTRIRQKSHHRSSDKAHSPTQFVPQFIKNVYSAKLTARGGGGHFITITAFAGVASAGRSWLESQRYPFCFFPNLTRNIIMWHNISARYIKPCQLIKLFSAQVCRLLRCDERAEWTRWSSTFAV